jgi:hypothetical protein
MPMPPDLRTNRRQGVIVNLTDRRADACVRRQLDLLDKLGPDGISGSSPSWAETVSAVGAHRSQPTVIFLFSYPIRGGRRVGEDRALRSNGTWELVCFPCATVDSF